MELYTNTMPNNCWECPCFNAMDEQPCGLAENDEKCYYRGVDEPEDAIYKRNKKVNSTNANKKAPAITGAF